MSAKMNMILCGLCIVTTFYAQQDMNIQQDPDDFMLVIGDDEEIYPLADSDTAYLMPEIQQSFDNLELDPVVQMDAQDDGIDYDDMQSTMLELALEPVNNSDNCVDENKSQDIVLDGDSQLSNELCNNDDNCNEYNDFEEQLDEQEDYPITIISQDQLEEILDNNQDEQLYGNIDADVIIPVDNAATQENQDLLSQTVTLPVPEEIIVDALTEDEDDIIPVPHDLINSVKKANKQKKKLEKLARKEKADFFKKLKKQQKNKD